MTAIYKKHATKHESSCFVSVRTQETLSTTSDAAKFHIMRSHYQASVWNQAQSLYPDLLPVTEMGWIASGTVG